MSGLLIFTVFFPAVAAAVVLLAVPRDSTGQARWLALLATLTVLVSSIVLVFAFDRSPGEPQANPFQFESQSTWIDAATVGFGAAAIASGE